MTKPKASGGHGNGAKPARGTNCRARNKVSGGRKRAGSDSAFLDQLQHGVESSPASSRPIHEVGKAGLVVGERHIAPRNWRQRCQIARSYVQVYRRRLVGEGALGIIGMICFGMAVAEFAQELLTASTL